MSGDANERGPGSAVVVTTSARATGRRPSLDERRRIVAQSLRVGNPGNNARELPTQADPRHDCQIELAVDEIKPYEHNPRRANNAKFDEIKESIRVCGIRNPITVTRRPGEAHFIVEAGGNTRLVAIQQLWTETKDPRFRKITVMFRPWRSESHVLIAHLVENEQRGELTFWDKANGVMALKAELEAEMSRPLSLRQLEEQLRQLGLPISRSSLGLFQFAIEKLGALGEAQAGLSGLDAKHIQPRVNLIKRYAEKRASINESDLYSRVLNPVFERHAHQYAQTRTFDAVALCRNCEEALAECLGEPLASVRMQLDALEKSPDRSSEDLNAMLGVPGVTATLSADTGVAASGATALTVRTADSAERPANEITPGHAPVRSALSRIDPGASAEETLARSRNIGPESRRESVPSNMVERLKQSVIAFARLTGVAECLNFTGVTACGYYMEPPQIPLDLQLDKPLRRWAWWLLALLCGQMHEEVSRRLPDASGWRRLRLCEGEDESALPLLLENELAGPVNLDVMLTDWLVDPRDQAATLFCEILTSVRSLRAALPQCYSPPNQAELLSEGE